MRYSSIITRIEIVEIGTGVAAVVESIDAESAGAEIAIKNCVDSENWPYLADGILAALRAMELARGIE